MSPLSAVVSEWKSQNLDAVLAVDCYVNIWDVGWCTKAAVCAINQVEAHGM